MIGQTLAAKVRFASLKSSLKWIFLTFLFTTGHAESMISMMMLSPILSARFPFKLLRRSV